MVVVVVDAIVTVAVIIVAIIVDKVVKIVENSSRQ